MYGLTTITPPTQEPISLAMAKSHLRIDTADDDNLISGLIMAARQYCENFQNRAYVEQTLELWLNDFPHEDYISIPSPPLQSVTSVKYYGTDDTEYTMDSTDYIVDAVSQPGRIALAYSEIWPTTTLRPANGVCVRFVSGYATYSSVVSTVATAVSKTSGDDFSTGWAMGKQINIAGTTYRIASVSGVSALTLATTAGTQTGVALLANDVPEAVKIAILLLVGHWYENREATAQSVSKEIDFAVKAILGQERIVPV